MNKSATQSIQKALKADDFTQARRLLKASLRDNPNDHWLLTRLAMTYYEQRKYADALRFSRMAIQSKPTCPLVLWDYACALDMVGDSDDAIQTWQTLVSRGVEAIANDECGEGLSWAYSLVNDSRYRIGLAFKDKGDNTAAVRWVEDHIDHRLPGVRGLYSATEVKRELATIQRECAGKQTSVAS